MQLKAFLVVTILLSSATLFAQESFTASWEQRATRTQSLQPAWPPPLITTYVGLIQVYRADFLRQTASNHVQAWNLDGGKGLNLIPCANTELESVLIDAGVRSEDPWTRETALKREGDD